MPIDGLERLPQSRLTPGWMPVVQFVTRSEPCWSIEEVEHHGSRFQIIVVNRAPKGSKSLAACYRDLGPATGKSAFAWWCSFDHTVDEAMDWAEWKREDNTLRDLQDESLDRRDIVSQYHDQNEQTVTAVKRNRRTLRATRLSRERIK